MLRLAQVERKAAELQEREARVEALERRLNATPGSAWSTHEDTGKPPVETRDGFCQTDLNSGDIDRLVAEWRKLDARITAIEAERSRDREARMQERCDELSALLERQKAAHEAEILKLKVDVMSHVKNVRNPFRDSSDADLRVLGLEDRPPKPWAEMGGLLPPGPSANGFMELNMKQSPVQDFSSLA